MSLSLFSQCLGSFGLGGGFLLFSSKSRFLQKLSSFGDNLSSLGDLLPFLFGLGDSVGELFSSRCDGLGVEVLDGIV